MNKLFSIRWHPVLVLAILAFTLLIVTAQIVNAQVIGEPPEIIDPMPPLYLEYYLPYVVK